MKAASCALLEKTAFTLSGPVTRRSSCMSSKWRYCLFWSSFCSDFVCSPAFRRVERSSVCRPSKSPEAIFCARGAGRRLEEAGVSVSISVGPCAVQTGAESREVQRRRCEIFMWKGLLDNSRKRGEGTSAFFDLLRCRKDVFIILRGIFQHKWSQSILTPRPMRMSPAPASR
jgi:hypothetical protein